MYNRFETPELTATGARVEQYLTELSVPVPAAERAEWRDEARQHLDSLIAAHEELGLSRDAAVEAALKSFGDARRIGAYVAREERRTARRAEAKELTLLLTAYGWGTMPFYLLAGVLIAAFALLPVGDSYLDFLAALSPLFFILCPFSGGWWMGRRTGPVARPLLAVCALAAVLSVPQFLMFAFLAVHLIPHHAETALGWALLWLPLTVSGAVTARQRQREASRER